MRFLSTIPLAITPLTPVHMGCGEDFEPTNYVLDQQWLYHFDPSLAALDERQRMRLKSIADGAARDGTSALLQMQQFVAEQAEPFIAVARHVVHVAAGVERQYRQRLGKVANREANGGRVLADLAIERHAHHPHSGLPYLPGSALKGALRTAVLSELNGGQNRPKDTKTSVLAAELLGGSFNSDPFRLVALSDAAGDTVISEVRFCVNRYKALRRTREGTELRSRSVATRRELVLPGQFRALGAELRLMDPSLADARARRGDLPDRQRRLGGFEALARTANAFYQARWSETLQVLGERGYASDAWLDGVERLLSGELGERLAQGRALLLRVGRHSGAESVTLDGTRFIRIMRPKEAGGAIDEPGARTVWLAADDEQASTGMQPLGFILVERAEDPPVAALRDWCAGQALPDLATLRAALTERRDAARQQLDQRRREAEARAAQRAAEEAAEEARRQARAAMSPQRQAVEELRERFVAYTAARREPISGDLYARMQKLLREAESPDWSPADRQALADCLEEHAERKIDLSDRKRLRALKEAIARLRAAGA